MRAELLGDEEMRMSQTKVERREQTETNTVTDGSVPLYTRLLRDPLVSPPLHLCRSLFDLSLFADALFSLAHNNEIKKMTLRFNSHFLSPFSFSSFPSSRPPFVPPPPHSLFG